jgi:hypothetical protein
LNGGSEFTSANEMAMTDKSDARKQLEEALDQNFTDRVSPEFVKVGSKLTDVDKRLAALESGQTLIESGQRALRKDIADVKDALFKILKRLTP